MPITPGYLVRDFARELGLPVVVAARPGLGTINHTLLTLEAARAVALELARRRAHALAGGAERDGALQPRRRSSASAASPCARSRGSSAPTRTCSPPRALR